jgi:single-strand selective monofunctional uracil DNA glycosylase
VDLIAETRKLAEAVDRLPTPRGVAVVLNPLAYAWEAHHRFLRRFTETEGSVGGHVYATSKATRRRVLIVGMNPGPHGMVQTGLPFGDVVSARKVLGLPSDYAPRVGQDTGEWTASPLIEPPTNAAQLEPFRDKGRGKRRVEGFAHGQVEESGRRLWGLLENLWGSIDAVLADCFMMNLCPLAYFAADGSNVTPADLDERDSAAVMRPCVDYLRAVLAAMRPEVIVAVGRWVEGELRGGRGATADDIADARHRSTDAYAQTLRSGYKEPRVVYLPHPSPRSSLTAAWAQAATATLGPLLPGARS